MFAIRSVLILLSVLALLGCSRQGDETVIGEGFVVPPTLNLRKDLGPRQPSVGTMKHGERVEILARRRRFAKVRSEAGAIGWVDGALLFGPEKMVELRALGERAAKLPSQGEATVLDTLNVHTDAQRDSPSFHQVKEGERVSVVEHRLVPRAVATLPPDDWSLVRYAPAEAGWVLSRMLYMAIPDEVAQYAEGHRITSYFSLGEIQDGSQTKHNWLWTTIVDGRQPYEFDSFRVFVWSLKRHRYETAYIERRVKGYYPVIVERPAGSAPRFTLIVEDKDGSRLVKTFTFQGFRVRMISKAPWNPPADASAASKAGAEADSKAPASTSWLRRFQQRVTSAWRALFQGQKK